MKSFCGGKIWSIFFFSYVRKSDLSTQCCTIWATKKNFSIVLKSFHVFSFYFQHVFIQFIFLAKCDSCKVLQIKSGLPSETLCCLNKNKMITWLGLLTNIVIQTIGSFMDNTFIIREYSSVGKVSQAIFSNFSISGATNLAC